MSSENKESKFTWELLKSQDSNTSNGIIALFTDHSNFIALSKKTSDSMLARDMEDNEKLEQGIQLAIDKKVLPVLENPSTIQINVMGKTVDIVVDEILSKVSGDVASGKGLILTLEGLSGTGKGTTVQRLSEKLTKTATWSNGNIFRSLTLLSVTYAEQHDCTLSSALTKDNLASFCGMLKFGKFNGAFDVKIDGLGIQALVSEIRNTVLSQPKIAKNIPTVARVTQGEVINFVKKALQIMLDDGTSVLLEGRAQTLKYIETPHRFELVLSDSTLIGKRRVAQRLGATAFAQFEETTNVTDAEVISTLESVLQTLFKKDQKPNGDKKQTKIESENNEETMPKLEVVPQEEDSDLPNLEVVEEDQKEVQPKTRQETILAGNSFTQVLRCKASSLCGTTLSWYFTEDYEYDVNFSITLQYGNPSAAAATATATATTTATTTTTTTTTTTITKTTTIKTTATKTTTSTTTTATTTTTMSTAAAASESASTVTVTTATATDATVITDATTRTAVATPVRNINESYIKIPTRCPTSKGSFTTDKRRNCIVIAEWDNTFSMFRSKTIKYYFGITSSPEIVEERIRKKKEEEERRRIEKERALKKKIERERREKEEREAREIQEKAEREERERKEREERLERERIERERIKQETEAISQFETKYQESKTEFQTRKEEFEKKSLEKQQQLQEELSKQMKELETELDSKTEEQIQILKKVGESERILEIIQKMKEK